MTVPRGRNGNVVGAPLVGARPRPVRATTRVAPTVTAGDGAGRRRASRRGHHVPRSGHGNRGPDRATAVRTGQPQGLPLRWHDATTAPRGRIGTVVGSRRDDGATPSGHDTVVGAPLVGARPRPDRATTRVAPTLTAGDGAGRRRASRRGHHVPRSGQGNHARTGQPHTEQGNHKGCPYGGTARRPCPPPADRQRRWGTAR